MAWSSGPDRCGCGTRTPSNCSASGYAQHQLPPQVLGQVGDQAILTSGDHQITGLEQATEGRSKRPAS